MRLLEGRCALVTGGGQGIGEAVARAVSRHGASVLIADANEESASRLAAELSAAGGKAAAFPLDVTDLAGCEALHARVRDLGYRVSIVVNNAGVSGSTTLEAPDARTVWDRQLNVNLTGPFNVTRAFLPSLIETKGAVVNLCSIASYNAATAAYGYMASKGGLKMLTQTMARELSRHGIRVNAVAPGLIETPMTAKRLATPELMKEMMPRIPMARTGKPEEIAEPIAFLCSDMASYVNGAILAVDGGFMAV